MASLIRAKRSFASKCWLVVAPWIVAAVVAGSLNPMQDAFCQCLRITPRSRTSVRARGGSGFSVDPDEVSVRERPAYHKMKTRQEQIEDVLAGVAAGGAAAAMLAGSVAATIYALNAPSPVASEGASPSVVVVPLAQEEVPRTPLAPKEGLFRNSAFRSAFNSATDTGGLAAAIRERAQSVIAALEARTGIAPADVESPIVAPVIARPARVVGPNGAATTTPRDDMLSRRGYHQPNSLYSGRH